MRDPLDNAFYDDIWNVVANNNTALFRTVFRCMPDNEVKTWKEYKEYSAYAERFSQSQGGGKSKDGLKPQDSDRPNTSGPPGASSHNEKLRSLTTPDEEPTNLSEKLDKIEDKIEDKLLAGDLTKARQEENRPRLSGTKEDWAADATRENEARFSANNKPPPSPTKDDPLDEKLALKHVATMPVEQQSNTMRNETRPRAATTGTALMTGTAATSTTSVTETTVGDKKRKRKHTLSEFRASNEIMPREQALELLEMEQGHLIVFPCDWCVVPLLLNSLACVCQRPRDDRLTL